MRKLLVVAAAVIALSTADAAYADVIFGSTTPTPPCSSTVQNGVGVLCAASENFGQVTATESGGAVLTDKLTSLNVSGESGLGVASKATACDDALCEAQPGQGITATGNAIRIVDAEVGSLQGGESFNFFVDGTQVASGVTNTCMAANFTPGGGGDTCVWNDPNPAGAASINVTDATGSITLVSVSFPAGGGPTGVSEPTSLMLLAAGLLGLWSLHRVWKDAGPLKAS
jgi:hypothetical protein